jgi:hypothetical protein
VNSYRPRGATIVAATLVAGLCGTVSAVTANSASADSCTTPSSSDKVTYDGAGMKSPSAAFRSGDAEVCSEIGRIPYGASVNLRCWTKNQYDNTWWSVRYGGQNGWVFIDNLAYASPGAGAKC